MCSIRNLGPYHEVFQPLHKPYTSAFHCLGCRAKGSGFGASDLRFKAY